MSSPFGGRSSVLSRQMEYILTTAKRNAIYRKGPQPRVIRFTAQRVFQSGQFQHNYVGTYLCYSILFSAGLTLGYKLVFYDNWMKSQRIWFEYNCAYATTTSKYNQAVTGWMKTFPLAVDNVEDVDFEEYCVNKVSDECPMPPLVDYDVKW